MSQLSTASALWDLLHADVVDRPPAPALPDVELHQLRSALAGSSFALQQHLVGSCGPTLLLPADQLAAACFTAAQFLPQQATTLTTLASLLNHHLDSAQPSPHPGQVPGPPTDDCSSSEDVDSAYSRPLAPAAAPPARGSPLVAVSCNQPLSSALRAAAGQLVMLRGPGGQLAHAPLCAPKQVVLLAPSAPVGKGNPGAASAMLDAAELHAVLAAALDEGGASGGLPDDGDDPEVALGSGAPTCGEVGGPAHRPCSRRVQLASLDLLQGCGLKLLGAWPLPHQRATGASGCGAAPAAECSEHASDSSSSSGASLGLESASSGSFGFGGGAGLGAIGRSNSSPLLGGYPSGQSPRTGLTLPFIPETAGLQLSDDQMAFQHHLQHHQDQLQDQRQADTNRQHLHDAAAAAAHATDRQQRTPSTSPSHGSEQELHDGGDGADGYTRSEPPEGLPCRHLWLGNMPLKPNKAAVEALFSAFGPLEYVRMFPGKTFGFVNFQTTAHAVLAKAQLDGQFVPAVTGNKPLVIRFQKDVREPPPKSASWASSLNTLDLLHEAGALTAGGPAALTALGSLPSAAAAAAASPLQPRGLTRSMSQLSISGLGQEDSGNEPAVNLSNRLNPNNVHFDKELAAQYKRMSKAEKEALWAQDRAMKQQAALGCSLFSVAASAAAAAASLHSHGLGGSSLYALQGGLAGANSLGGLGGQLGGLRGQLASTGDMQALLRAQNWLGMGDMLGQHANSHLLSNSTSALNLSALLPQSNGATGLPHPYGAPASLQATPPQMSHSFSMPNLQALEAFHSAASGANPLQQQPMNPSAYLAAAAAAAAHNPSFRAPSHLPPTSLPDPLSATHLSAQPPLNPQIPSSMPPSSLSIMAPHNYPNLAPSHLHHAAPPLSPHLHNAPLPTSLSHNNLLSLSNSLKQTPSWPNTSAPFALDPTHHAGSPDARSLFPPRNAPPPTLSPLSNFPLTSLDSHPPTLSHAQSSPDLSIMSAEAALKALADAGHTFPQHATPPSRQAGNPFGGQMSPFNAPTSTPFSMGGLQPSSSMNNLHALSAGQGPQQQAQGGYLPFPHGGKVMSSSILDSMDTPHTQRWM